MDVKSNPWFNSAQFCNDYVTYVYLQTDFCRKKSLMSRPIVCVLVIHQKTDDICHHSFKTGLNFIASLSIWTRSENLPNLTSLFFTERPNTNLGLCDIKWKSWSLPLYYGRGNAKNIDFFERNHVR